MKFPKFPARPPHHDDTLRLPRLAAFFPRFAGDAEALERSTRSIGRAPRPVPIKIVAALFMMVSIAVIVLAESLSGLN